MQMTDNPIFALVAEYLFINESHIEKQIAQITLENIGDFRNVTIEKIAEMCGVSVSTYMRFCKKIGYASFTVFKVKISDALDKYMFVNTPFSNGETYSPDVFWTQAKKLIDDDYAMLTHRIDIPACEKTVQALYESKRIFIVDLFYSTVRFALHSDLAVTGKRVCMVHPSGCVEYLHQKGIEPQDMVLFVYDGSLRTRDIGRAIEECRKIRCHISVITCQEHFTAEKLCDEIIYIGKASSAVSSVMLHDLVFQYFSTLYRQKYIKVL